MKNKSLLFGCVIIGIFALIAIFAPFISPGDPGKIDQNNLLMPPSGQHLLGTDGLGRDLASRIIYGARISLSIGLIAVGIATFIGLILD